MLRNATPCAVAAQEMPTHILSAGDGDARLEGLRDGEGVVAGVEAGLLAGRAMHRPAGVVAVHEPAWVVIDPAVSVPNDVTQLSGGVSGIESMLNEKSPSRAAWCVVTSIV